MADFPALRTRRLLLREFRLDDAPALLDIFSRDDTTQHYNLDTMHTLAEAEGLVRARIGLFAKGHGIRWALTLAGDTERVIGSCGCYHLHRAFQSTEIGYELHPDHWRQGLMSEALAAMLDYCFSDRFFFPLNRVEAVTTLDNGASLALLKKLGFREEGIRREYGYWKGRFHDVRALALLRRDWPTSPSRQGA